MSKRDSLKILRDTAKIYFLDVNHFSETAITKYHYEDTGITNFRFHDPNIIHQVNYSNLGNLGTVFQPILFKPIQHPGFQYGQFSLENYLFTPTNTNFYLTLRPLTKLMYVVGVGPEQMLKVMHTQRVLKNLQLGVEYNHINSKGFYKHQNTIHHNFRMFGRYASKNNRYKMIAAYIHNNILNQENGGLANDTNFIDNGFEGTQFVSFQNRAGYDVRLDSATNNVFNHIAYLNQAYTFYRKKDSLTELASPLLTFMHELNYEFRGYRYRDTIPDTSYYSSIVFDSSITRNTTEFHRVDNQFKVLLYLRKKQNASSPLTLGIRHEFIHANHFVRTKDITYNDTSILINYYHNLSVFGGITFNITPEIDLSAYGNFYFAGYNLGDFLASFRFRYLRDDSLKANHQLIAGVNFRQFEPSYFYQNFRSNHSNWQINLIKQREIHIYAKYKVPHWFLDVDFNSYLQNNYVYLDENKNPTQSNTVDNVFTLSIHKRFRAWKIYFEPTLIGQYSTTDKIRIPNFVGRMSIYFEGFVFKKALLLQAGFDISYNTPYLANAYDPITSQFYLQNTITTGNYPFADVFIAGKIKTVRVFFKLQNANQRFPNIPYFGAPHHPLQDRTFQFGISWNLYN